MYLDEPLPGPPRHVWTKVACKYQKNWLGTTNIYSYLTTKIENTQKPSNYDEPKLLHDWESKDESRFREINQDILNNTCFRSPAESWMCIVFFFAGNMWDPSTLKYTKIVKKHEYMPKKTKQEQNNTHSLTVWQRQNKNLNLVQNYTPCLSKKDVDIGYWMISGR